MIASDTATLLTLVERKHDVLLRMSELARRQEESIQGDMTQLFRVLSAKQRLLNDLQKTEDELAPFKGQEPAERRWRSPDERVRCAKLLNECSSLLQDIIGRERASELQLHLRRDEAATRLERLHVAHDTHAAYSTADGSASASIDLMTGP